MSYESDRSLAAWARIIMREPTPSWTCPDCGSIFYGAVMPFNACPACRRAKEKLEQDYWDNKRAGMRSITSNIVAKILSGGN